MTNASDVTFTLTYDQALHLRLIIDVTSGSIGAGRVSWSNSRNVGYTASWTPSRTFGFNDQREFVFYNGLADEETVIYRPVGDGIDSVLSTRLTGLASDLDVVEQFFIRDKIGLTEQDVLIRPYLTTEEVIGAMHGRQLSLTGATGGFSAEGQIWRVGNNSYRISQSVTNPTIDYSTRIGTGDTISITVEGDGPAVWSVSNARFVGTNGGYRQYILTVASVNQTGASWSAGENVTIDTFPTTTAASDGQTLAWSASESAYVPTDTLPALGDAGQVLRVNSGETAAEWGDAIGAVYRTGMVFPDLTGDGSWSNRCSGTSSSGEGAAVNRGGFTFVAGVGGGGAFNIPSDGVYQITFSLYGDVDNDSSGGTSRCVLKGRIRRLRGSTETPIGVDQAAYSRGPVRYPILSCVFDGH